MEELVFKPLSFLGLFNVGLNIKAREENSKFPSKIKCTSNVERERERERERDQEFAIVKRASLSVWSWSSACQ